MLALEDEDGLFFAPPSQVASITPEFAGRWRVVLADGRLTYGANLTTLLNLEHLTPEADGRWRDPAGFTYPAQTLQPVAPTRPLPAIEGLPCPPERVRGFSQAAWLTDEGEVPCAKDAHRLHPELVQLRRDLWVNQRRLGRIQKEASNTWHIRYDDGTLALTVYRIREPKVAQALGLSSLSHLPLPRALFREQMRDYPIELALCSAQQLKSWFSSARQLTANLIFQALRYRQQGVAGTNYGHDHRGFWYAPTNPTLVRAGFLQPHPECERATDDPHYVAYTSLLGQLVGEDQLFTYAELGFEDPGAGQAGTTRPQTILLVEKDSLEHYARPLADEFGLSWIVTGGYPKLIDVEFFARRLASFGLVFRVIAFVDFDPEGWQLADAFVRQLRRFGIEVQTQILFLVRPESFTAEDLELYALPCHSGTPAKSVSAWLERGGGIQGQPLCLHANHLQPLSRLREALVRAL